MGRSEYDYPSFITSPGHFSIPVKKESINANTKPISTI